MGIDTLAFSFDAEKHYGVRLDIRSFIVPRHGSDPTAGELFDWLCAELRSTGLPDETDAWSRFTALLSAHTDHIPAESTQRDHRLMADLGLTG